MDSVLKTARVFGAWCNRPVELVLKENEIACLSEEDVIYSVSLTDVIGLRVLDRPAPGNPARRAQAELCSFGVDKGMKKPKRKMKSTLIWFDEGETYETNQQKALEWRNDIQLQCLKNDNEVFVNQRPGDNMSLEPPRILAIINPFSGRKKGLKCFHSKVQPLFEVAGVKIEQELVTQRQNHAKEFIQSFDFSTITGIVVVGGDGTLYEVVNGIMNRSDWEDTIETPFGIIPTGSGNAVLSSLLYEQSEEYCVENAILQIVRGGIQSIDLATVNTPKETVHMFTALTWGLIGDTDIESERVRFLGGEIREALGGLKCIAQKRVYHGKLKYLPSESPADKERHVQLQKNDVQGEDDQTDQENGQETLDSSNNSDPPQQPGTMNEGVAEQNQSESCPPSTGATPTSTIPTLAESDWITVDEEEFISVAVLMVPLLTNKFIGHPNVVLGGGEFYIVYVGSGAKRKELFQAMMAMDTGEYINFPKINTIRTRAFHIQPITSPGRLVVDGEVVDYGSTEGKMGGHMNIFSRKSK